LLRLFTKNVLETALNEEMTEHLGHEKNQAEEGRRSTNVRNGARSKTVVSDAAGEVSIGRSSVSRRWCSETAAGAGAHCQKGRAPS
jgi:hypothetical protein